MKTLVLIPARGGSKGLAAKNIRSFNGTPLLVRTMQFAQNHLSEHTICLSTDSEEYVQLVSEHTSYETPFLRPAEFATDTSSLKDVILHALEQYRKEGKEFDNILVLQCTSPLRSIESVQKAMEIYTPQIDMVASVNEAKSNPYFVQRTINEEGELDPLMKGASYTSRQECPIVYELNGVLFIINVKSLLAGPIAQFEHVKPIVTTQEESVDIDDEMDFLLAEIIDRKVNG